MPRGSYGGCRTPHDATLGTELLTVGERTDVGR